MGSIIIDNSQNSEVRIIISFSSNDKNLFFIQSGGYDQFNVQGSSLLAIMDDYAFNHFEQEGNISSRNIGKTYIPPSKSRVALLN